MPYFNLINLICDDNFLTTSKLVMCHSVKISSIRLSRVKTSYFQFK